jgi:hypothetical protein
LFILFMSRVRAKICDVHWFKSMLISDDWRRKPPIDVASQIQAAPQLLFHTEIR